MSVTKIQKHAFAATNAVKVTVPEGVETIETEAFLYTPLMRMIELPPKLKEIEPDSFLLMPGPSVARDYKGVNSNVRSNHRRYCWIKI